MKKTIPVLVFIVLFGFGWYLFSMKGAPEIKDISPDPVPVTIYKDLIQIERPLSGAIITNPVTLSGKARGNWYFEASFPVQILDEDGTLLGQGSAQAEGDWMTIDYVPFSASLNFSAPKGSTGKIIFKKDNPSGDPERDESVEVPVRFK